MPLARLLTCLAILAVTTPALCAQFFIVQEPGMNRCTITDTPPAQGAGTIVGDGGYGDRETAEFEMKRIAACAETPR
jgi:hypothetical protein